MRKITKKDLIKYFIGRQDIYLEGYKKEDNIIDQLDGHLSNKTRIGSYGTYQSKRLRDKEYNRYRRRDITVDIDRHDFEGKELEDELKMVEKEVDIILSRSKHFFGIDKSYIIKSRSPRGFHLTTILKKDTLLKNVLIYRDYIQSRIETFLKEEIEVFPKTKDIENVGFGFAVYLPSPDTLVPDVIKELNLKDVLVDYKSFMNKQKRTYKKVINVNIKNQKKFEQETKTGKWEQVKFTSDKLEKYRNDFECDKCVRNFLNGQQLNGENGNLMRIQCAMRLNRDGFSKEEIVQAFWSQNDFSYDITNYRVNIIVGVYSKYPRCKTVYDLGFCDSKCLKNRIWKKEIEKIEKNEQIIQGFNGLHSKINEQINKKGIFFLEKTTRSGTTTSVVIQSIVEKKNLLMIAPTKKIYNDTVQEAIDIGIKDNYFTPFEIPNKFRIKSGKDRCKRIRDELKKYPELEDFDFLLQPKCKKCSYKNNCVYYKFTQNIEDYSIIYLTTAKLKALINSAEYSERNKKLLDNLIYWTDVIFLDEFNHLIQMNVKGFIIDGENPNTDKIDTFLIDCKHILSKIKLKDKRLIKSSFYMALDDFIAHIEFHINSINLYTPKNEKNFVEEFKTLFPKERLKFIRKDNEWSSSFSHLVDYCKKLKDKNVAKLLKLFFALHTTKLYLQKLSPKDRLPRIEMRWFENPLPVFDLINSLELKKTILITDAVESNLKIEKLMKNIQRVIINDPNYTAEKQQIITHQESDPTYPINVMYSKQNTKIIKNFLNEFKDKEFQIFCRNMKVEKYVRKLLKEMDFKYNKETLTYFRSPYNYGVKSDYRLQLVIGNTFIPKHVYDYFAKECIKQGYFPKDENYLELGSFFENFDAMSTFIQAISRSKDPFGKIKSVVHTLGIKKKLIEQWFDTVKIPTPEVKGQYDDYFEK